jgi:hypothetical protein
MKCILTKSLKIPVEKMSSWRIVQLTESLNSLNEKLATFLVDELFYWQKVNLKNVEFTC